MWVCRNVIGTTHLFLMVGIPPKIMVMNGGWCKWHGYTNINKSCEEFPPPVPIHEIMNFYKVQNMFVFVSFNFPIQFEFHGKKINETQTSIGPIPSIPHVVPKKIGPEVVPSPPFSNPDPPRVPPASRWEPRVLPPSLGRGPGEPIAVAIGCGQKKTIGGWFVAFNHSESF